MRPAAARLLRFLSGETAQQSGEDPGDNNSRIGQHVISRRLFLRALGLVYFIAFVSFDVQIEGLIGSHGITPAAEYLKLVSERLSDSHWQLPTLAWMDASDASLHLIARGGAALSLVLVIGYLPLPITALLWLLYLSLVSIGNVFMGYQWDALLLETGLLSILFSPPVFRLSKSGPPSIPSLFLMRWLLFRLMLLSGLVKWLSGDETWRNLTALQYHYWSQPIPTWTSYYMHQLPSSLQRASTGVMFAIEVILPFFVFGFRRMRLVAFVAFTFLQLLILGTGNYGFFNWLAIVLGLNLLDDAALLRLIPMRARPKMIVTASPRRASQIGTVLLIPVFVLLFTLSTVHSLDRIGFDGKWPEWIDSLREKTAPYRSINSYGLFAVMTTKRDEILIEGSNDGQIWRPYVFRWKPGPLDRAPEFVAPHMPRLDWQMWFAALGDCQHNRWFQLFEKRLLEGSPAVTSLIENNPFAVAPPKYLRSTVSPYRFTTMEEKRSSGAWWRQGESHEYCPTLELRDGKLYIRKGP